MSTVSPLSSTTTTTTTSLNTQQQEQQQQQQQQQSSNNNNNTSSNQISSSSSSSSTSTSSKSKTKYNPFDINQIFKGKSLENPKTSVIVPKHGLQTVGKVLVGRRVPPPANVTSSSSSSTSTLSTTTTTTTTSNIGLNSSAINDDNQQQISSTANNSSNNSSSNSSTLDNTNNLSCLNTNNNIVENHNYNNNNEKIGDSINQNNTTTRSLSTGLNQGLPNDKEEESSSSSLKGETGSGSQKDTTQHLIGQQQQNPSKCSITQSVVNHHHAQSHHPPSSFSHHHPQQKQQHHPQLPPTDLYSPMPQTAQNHAHAYQQQYQKQFQKEFPPISTAGGDVGGRDKSASIPKESNILGAAGGGSRRESLATEYQQKQHRQTPPLQLKGPANVLQDGGGERENDQNQSGSGYHVRDHSADYHHSYRHNHPNNNKNLHHSSSASNLPSSQMSAANDLLYHLPTANDFPLIMSSSSKNISDPLNPQQSLNRNTNRRNDGYSSSSSNQNYGPTGGSSGNSRKSHNRSERKFALEKPAIIDDKELKSLDKILKTDLDCDWADEKEIDYGAKIHFSDGDDSTDDDDDRESNKTMEREDSQPKSVESSTKSIPSSLMRDNVRQSAYHPSSREASASNSMSMYPPPSNRGQMDPRTAVPPPNIPPHEANRYYGRKSDPLYETINRKDNLNEHYDERRGEYHVSSRSQQLPRGGGRYLQQQYLPPPPPPLQPQLQMQPSRSSRENGRGDHSGSSQMNCVGSEEENWRPKPRLKDEVSNAVLRGRQSRDADHDEMMMPPPPPQSNRDRRDSTRDYRSDRLGGPSSGGYSLSGNKSSIYPPPNLPPRLQKQIEQNMHQKNSSARTRSPSQQQQGDQIMNGGQVLMDQRHSYRDYPSSQSIYDQRGVPQRDSHHRRTPPDVSYNDGGRQSSGRFNTQKNEPASWRNTKPNDNRETLPSQQSSNRKDSSDVSSSSSSTTSATTKPTPLSQSQSDPHHLEQSKESPSKDLPNTNKTHHESIESKPSAAQPPESEIEVVETPVSDPPPEKEILPEDGSNTETSATNKPAVEPSKVDAQSNQNVENEVNSQQQKQSPVLSTNQQPSTLTNQKSYKEDNGSGSHTNQQPQHYRSTNSRGSYADSHQQSRRRDGGSRYMDHSNDNRQHPQRKYSNNSTVSSDRYTPPSTCPSNQIQRRDNYTNSNYQHQGSSSNYQHNQSQQPTYKSNVDSSSIEHSSSQLQQQTYDSTNNRSRHDSISSNSTNTTTSTTNTPAPTPPVVAPVSSPPPPPPPPSQTTALTNTTTNNNNVIVSTATSLPSGPVVGLSTNIRAISTYGPPPTTAKVFGDQAMIQPASTTPPVQNSNVEKRNTTGPNPVTNQNQAIKHASGGSSGNVVNKPQPQGTSNRRDERNDHHHPQQRISSGGHHRPSSGAGSSSSRYGSRNVQQSKPQRSSTHHGSASGPNSAVSHKSMVPPVSKSPGASSISNAPTARQQSTTSNSSAAATRQESEDFIQDEWETASESSDLMERSMAEVSSSAENRNKLNDEKPSSQAQQQTSASNTTASKHGSDRTIYTSKSSAHQPPSSLHHHQQQDHHGSYRTSGRHDRGERPSNRGNDSMYQQHHSSSSSRHHGSSSAIMNSYHARSSGGVSRHTTRGGGSGNSSTSGYRGGSGNNSTMLSSSAPKRSSNQGSLSMAPNSNYHGNQRHHEQQMNVAMSKMTLSDSHDAEDTSLKSSERNRKNSSGGPVQSHQSSGRHHGSNTMGDSSTTVINNQQKQTYTESEQQQQQGTMANKKMAQPHDQQHLNNNRSRRKSDQRSSKPNNNNKSNQNQQQQSQTKSANTNRSQQDSTQIINQKDSVQEHNKSAGNVTTVQRSNSNSSSSNFDQSNQDSSLVSRDDGQSSITKESSTTNPSTTVVKKTETPLNITRIPDMIDEVVSTTPSTVATNNNNSATSISQSISSSTSKSYTVNSTTASTTSAINEELNMKIASVKKVWDTAPNEIQTTNNNNNSQQTQSSGERKNSLLSATSPTDKTQQQQQQKINNGNLSNIKKQSNPNIFTASGNAQIINATSPPVVVSTSAYSGFQHHQNVLQTPTSPPTISHQIYQNPLAAATNPQQNPAALAAAFHQYNAASGQLSHHDQTNFTGNPAANTTNASQASAGLSHSHGAQVTFPHIPAFAMHQQPNVVAAVQQSQFNQMALAMMQASSNAPAANLQFLTQLNAAQPQALGPANTNDHQFNKFTLAAANPNAVAMMKSTTATFVPHHPHHHQQANHHNLQQTAGGWPATGQQLQQANQQHFFTQLAAAATNPAANALGGFVPAPLNLNNAAGASAILPTNGSQTQLSQNSYHNNRQTAGTMQRVDPSVVGNPNMASIRSFAMGPTADQMHHHQMATASNQFMNDGQANRTTGSAAGIVANQQHNVAGHQNHRNSHQFFAGPQPNATPQTSQALNIQAAANWTAAAAANQQLAFFNHQNKMQHQANGRSQPQGQPQQFPMHLMMNNALAAAAHHAGGHHVQQHQMNSRTSPLTNTNSFPNNSVVANAGNSYQPNPIQRPNAQQSGVVGKGGMMNQSSNNRNGSNKSFNNQQGIGKSRQYQNRNNSTPSPGTNINNNSAINQTNTATSTNVNADYNESGSTGTTNTSQTSTVPATNITGTVKD
ncbi:uncharacterized protein LOC124500390 isoform X5 [Dermatophagoides farinae]|uniref:uncharacterized protein LOC124500390 isoform X5 n=1 Tax=Dermatophagoides farinae TaxID=6954 RepID=UPI003F6174FD